MHILIVSYITTNQILFFLSYKPIDFLSHLWHIWLPFKCHSFVLTTIWHQLWSITEQTHHNIESIENTFKMDDG